jgi:hypothetical protein
VLNRNGYPALAAFFASLGVPLREEGEGRVYPAALLASAAVEALLLRASQLGVEFVTGARVAAVEREGNGFRLRAEQTPEEPQNIKKSKPAGAPNRAPRLYGSSFSTPTASWSPSAAQLRPRTAPTAAPTAC